LDAASILPQLIEHARKIAALLGVNGTWDKSGRIRTLQESIKTYNMLFYIDILKFNLNTYPQMYPHMFLREAEKLKKRPSHFIIPAIYSPKFFVSYQDPFRWSIPSQSLAKF
jgi:hypothetical protein